MEVLELAVASLELDTLNRPPLFPGRLSLPRSHRFSPRFRQRTASSPSRSRRTLEAAIYVATIRIAIVEIRACSSYTYVSFDDQSVIPGVYAEFTLICVDVFFRGHVMLASGDDVVSAIEQSLSAYIAVHLHEEYSKPSNVLVNAFENNLGRKVLGSYFVTYLEG